MPYSPSTPHTLSDGQDNASISWDLSSYSMSSNSEDDDQSAYFHLVGDHIAGAHEMEQSASPHPQTHCDQEKKTSSECSEVDKCTACSFCSDAEWMLRKIFPFLFNRPAISRIEANSKCTETVRNAPFSPTSVIFENKLWAQLFSTHIDRPTQLNSQDRQEI
jgi:hypothetical protein